jgi:hypothetical protein
MTSLEQQLQERNASLSADLRASQDAERRTSAALRECDSARVTAECLVMSHEGHIAKLTAILKSTEGALADAGCTVTGDLGDHPALVRSLAAKASGLEDFAAEKMRLTWVAEQECERLRAALLNERGWWETARTLGTYAIDRERIGRALTRIDAALAGASAGPDMTAWIEEQSRRDPFVFGHYPPAVQAQIFHEQHQVSAPQEPAPPRDESAVIRLSAEGIATLEDVIANPRPPTQKLIDLMAKHRVDTPAPDHAAFRALAERWAPNPGATLPSMPYEMGCNYTRSACARELLALCKPAAEPKTSDVAPAAVQAVSVKAGETPASSSGAAEEPCPKRIAHGAHGCTLRAGHTGDCDPDLGEEPYRDEPQRACSPDPYEGWSDYNMPAERPPQPRVQSFTLGDDRLSVTVEERPRQSEPPEGYTLERVNANWWAFLAPDGKRSEWAFPTRNEAISGAEVHAHNAATFTREQAPAAVAHAVATEHATIVDETGKPRIDLWVPSAALPDGWRWENGDIIPPHGIEDLELLGLVGQDVRVQYDDRAGYIPAAVLRALLREPAPAVARALAALKRAKVYCPCHDDINEAIAALSGGTGGTT